MHLFDAHISGWLPEAPAVSAARIRFLQADQQYEDQFVIVDVRSKTETDVSLIPGAITKAEFEKSRQQHIGKTVIVYCTVGYRSGIFASQLQHDGWDARNYEGSILDWCDNGLPLVTSMGEQTKLVHTYKSRYEVALGYQSVY